MVQDSGLMFKVKGKMAKRNYTFSIYFKVNRTRLIEELNGIRIDPLKKEIWQEQYDTKSGSLTYALSFNRHTLS